MNSDFKKQGLVDHKRRNKRLRLLIKKVKEEQKQQGQKIDILCKDLISEQREFIKKLGTISFTANFYESIVGTTELNSLLSSAGKLIKDEMPDANVAFFLRQAKSFKLYMFESDQPITLEEQRPESCFTAEIVDNICKSNKVCTLDCLFEMGLQGNLNMLNKISAVTLPLGQLGPSLGFVLLYRSSENKLTAEELNNISAVTRGLSRAIQSCQELSRSTD